MSRMSYPITLVNNYVPGMHNKKLLQALQKSTRRLNPEVAGLALVKGCEEE